MAKKILILEDSVMVLNIFKRALEQLGYDVDTCENGREGLAAVEKAQYDLIFTDLNMPFINGVDFVRRVRTMDNYKETPIVLVSSDAVASRKSDAKEAGASGWITKPFDAAKIQAQVEHFLKA